MSVQGHYGSILRRQRVKISMSLRECAALLGLTHVQLGNVERGLSELTAEQVDKWCAHYVSKSAPMKVYVVLTGYTREENMEIRAICTTRDRAHGIRNDVDDGKMQADVEEWDVLV